MDFVIPKHRLAEFTDEQWEIHPEPAVESMMTRLGYPDTVAIFDETFTSHIKGDLRQGDMEAFVFARESDFDIKD